MANIKIEDLVFKPFLNEKEIGLRVKEMASELSKAYRGKNPIFICVLNGSFFVTADILKQCVFEYELSFVKVKSYDGLQSANEIKEFIGLNCDIENRHVVIIEDIVESGLTTNYLIGKLKEEHPSSIEIATLLFKPNKLKHSGLPIKYVGFEIGDEFVVGYGLDYNQKGRNLRSIYQLVSD